MGISKHDGHTFIYLFLLLLILNNKTLRRILSKGLNHTILYKFQFLITNVKTNNNSV